MVIKLLQKQSIMRLSIVLCFFFISNSMYSQTFDGKYVTPNCEYIHFVNDTLVNFVLIGSHRGALAQRYKGIGMYKIENEYLIVVVGEYPSLSSEMYADLHCSDYIEKISGIDKYKIEILSDTVIKLTGLIIDDYENLNRKRHLKSFINFPWKWRFKNKQQWYSPRIRELTKCPYI